MRPIIRDSHVLPLKTGEDRNYLSPHLAYAKNMPHAHHIIKSLTRIVNTRELPLSEPPHAYKG